VKILFLCYEQPAPEIAGSHRVLCSLEYLAGKYRHDITLLAFRLRGKSYPNLGRYARIETVEVARRSYWKRMLSYRKALNILSGQAFINYDYSPQMDARVKALLNEGCDIVAVDHPAMLGYVLGKGVPVLLLEAFAAAEITRHEYRLEKNLVKKAGRLFYHWQAKGYARVYRRVDRLIAVSAHQRDMVLAHDAGLNITVIPHGVEASYLEAAGEEDAEPTLAVTGSMSGPRNVAAVLWFYREVYPLIKEKVPAVRLGMVGSSPAPAIRGLTADTSVIVTGYVPDLRPYLRRAWVVVAPLLEGFGVKVRVLQAMAAGRPVVATPPVTWGIDVSPGENIVIATGAEEFAGSVAGLLSDRPLRERIGTAARRLMAAEHSWEKLADRLNEVLESAARKSPG
jgi:glycosyltransferase involved in cell wall biosynthesis